MIIHIPEHNHMKKDLSVTLALFSALLSTLSYAQNSGNLKVADNGF